MDHMSARAQPLLVQQAQVVQDEPGDRTRFRPGHPRLWPPDHAGVLAQLKLWAEADIVDQAPAIASLP